jgi:hypothetical protein
VASKRNEDAKLNTAVRVLPAILRHAPSAAPAILSALPRPLAASVDSRLQHLWKDLNRRWGRVMVKTHGPFSGVLAVAAAGHEPQVGAGCMLRQTDEREKSE